MGFAHTLNLILRPHLQVIQTAPGSSLYSLIYAVLYHTLIFLENKRSAATFKCRRSLL